MVLKLEPGQWYVWEAFPSTRYYPACAPFLLRGFARSPRLRGGLELQIEFGLVSPQTGRQTVLLHPRKKSTGYWVCRLHGADLPEPTVVLSILNTEWLYVHCPSLRSTLSESAPDRHDLQAILKSAHSQQIAAPGLSS